MFGNQYVLGNHQNIG